jgi:cell division septation protein DedD
MSSLSILFLLAMTSSPSSTEVMADLDAHPWRPAPAAPVAAESTSRTQTPSAPQAIAAPASKPVPKDASAASASWQLQLGALSSQDAANAEKKRFEKILGSGTVDIFVDGSIHKLRYGKFASKDDAETARAGLKAKGVDGFPALRP